MSQNYIPQFNIHIWILSNNTAAYKAFLTLLADGDLSYPTARISYV